MNFEQERAINQYLTCLEELNLEEYVIYIYNIFKALEEKPKRFQTEESKKLGQSIAYYYLQLFPDDDLEIFTIKSDNYNIQLKNYIKILIYYFEFAKYGKFNNPDFNIEELNKSMESNIFISDNRFKLIFPWLFFCVYNQLKDIIYNNRKDSKEVTKFEPFRSDNSDSLFIS